MSQPNPFQAFLSRIGIFAQNRHPENSKRSSRRQKNRIRSGRRRLFAELLEDRRLLATYVVNTTSDSGAGSLRQAIIDANTTIGVADTITFNIGTGQKSIAPLTALPNITDTVTIDGTTQPGFAGSPLIELRGDSLPAVGTDRGLFVAANNTQIRGLVINRFFVGIEVNNTSGAVIAGNWIGTDATGNAAAPNRDNGISLQSTIGSTIGGTTAAARNIISGNTAYGVSISGVGSSTNQVFGNFIGMDATGANAVGNGSGVVIIDAPNNQIGSGATGSGNLISGNGFGVTIQGLAATASGNKVQGNRFGLDQSETNFVASPGGYDIVIAYNSASNIVGTDSDGTNDSGERNVFGGQGTAAIFIEEFAGYTIPTGNVIAGNYIGLKSTGTASPGQYSRGVFLWGGTGTRIGTNADGTNDDGERNVIVPNANSAYGILMIDGTLNTTVAGNYIGTNPAGTTSLAAIATIGVAISANATAATGNIIGGTTLASRNIISGTDTGVFITGTQSSNNQVLGNFIGTNAAGSGAIANSIGVLISAGASNNTIGGTGTAAGNLISGNAQFGISVQGIGTANNTILGNRIGTNSLGTLAVPNRIGVLVEVGAANTAIGGPVVGAGNLISGNAESGIGQNVNTTGTVVQGNFIGTDVTGTASLDNGGDGILAAGPILIGGLTTTPGTGVGNVISSNGSSPTNGGGNIRVGGSGVVVQGNIIGLDKSGVNVIRQATQYGIWSLDSTAITIGGLTAQSRNIISGNGSAGILLQGGSGHLVQNNFIGTDITGNLDKGNSIFGITTDSSNSVFRGNVISGNDVVGFSISGVAPNASNLQLVGNTIGLNAAGNSKISNANNGLEINGANQVTVGGPVPSDRNVISGNTSSGISIVGGASTTNIVIQGNFIGTGADGSTAQGNDAAGITIGSGVIGTVISGNTISGNATQGVLLTGAKSTLIQGNFIGTNAVGSSPVPNDIGVYLNNGASDNTIAGNFIGNSRIDAISLSNGAANNSISGNSIGINATGSAIPNAIGIHVLATAGINPINDNQIRFSTSDNILVEAPSTVLRRNVSADMGGLPIRLNPSTLSPGTITVTQVVNGANPLVLGEVRAKPSTSYTIDLFSSPIAGQASNYITSSTATTDATGFAAFSIASTAGKLNGYVSATLTGLDVSGNTSTSSLSAGVLATPTIILGLLSQSPEGTPITLTAFSSSNPVTGYLWQVTKDGSPYTYELRNDGTQSEGGIQFTPDNQGTYTVSLRVTLNDGSQFLLGPFVINVYNVAPTPSFEYGPSSPVALSPITLTSNNSDPGKIDVLKTSWVVRTGSATGPIVYSTTPSTATTTSFTPAGGDLYYVTMTVDDGDGGVRTQTRVIEVAGLPATADIVVPQPTAVEGQKVRARASESLLNRTETLSFVWTLTKTPTGVGAVPSAYPFTIPSPGVIEFVPNDDGVYTIGLTVFKAGTTTGGIVAPTQIVTVTNANPRVSIVRAPVDSGSSQATLNAPLSLSAVVTDPGTADTQTILWSVKRDNQVLPVTGNGANFNYTPTIAGIYEISAQATDDDFTATNPIGRNSGSRVFTVNGTAVNVTIVPPAGVTLATTLTEGTGYTFTATVPAGVTAYAWKARTTEGVSVSQATTASFTFTPPQGGRYQIELQVTLADGTVANAVYGPLAVAGLAPAISSLAVLLPTTTPIYEGTAITVRTTAVDARDPIGLTYRWELQKPGAAAYSDVGAVDGSPIDLRFTPEDQGTYSVRVSVSDSQGLITTRVLAISVLNALPVARLNATYLASSPTQLNFSAIASDPGTADTLRYEWSVNGGAFGAPVANNNFVAPLAGLNNVRVRVTDKDGGSTTTSYYVIQGTGGNDSYTITASDVTASGNADEILYLALDGNDNITIAGNVTKKVVVLGGAGNDTINASAATVNVLLDGGDGDDILTGGTGDDVLIAGIGTNILVGGDGNNRFIGGGNDTMTGGKNSDYYEVHFSTVVINDTTGGSDTIDLTAAQAGVSLNLSNNTGTPQPVFTGSTLALNGSFERLIGSTYDDSLSTSTSDTTIEGGTGNDTLTSSASNTTLDGGGGNDAIQLNNAAGVFNGGGGNDTIFGTLQSTTSTSIATGDGDDVINVAGPSASTVAPVKISVGGGTNSVTAKNVSGKIYANNGGSSASVSAFGSASTGTSTLSVSSSTNVGIFGSATTTSTISVTSSTNVGIFGTGTINLDSVIGATLTSTVFGSASSIATIAAVSNSNNVGIFGSATSGGPSMMISVANTTNVGIFGSASSPASTIAVSGGYNVGIFGIHSGTVSLTDIRSGVNTIELSDFGSATSNATVSLSVASTTNVGIFGSATSSGPTLIASVSNSNNVGIFAGGGKTGLVTVTGGGNIQISGLNDGDIRLNTVDGVSVTSSSFGSATTTPSAISVSALGSTNVGIFGSASSNGPSLIASVNNSTNVGIFGSASGVSTIAVTSSTNVGIFGSATSSSSTMIASVNNSTNVGIYSSSSPGDQINVTGGSNVGIYNLLSAEVKLNGVNGSEIRLSDFGSAASTNVIVSASNSSNVGIFGSASSTGPSLIASVNNSTNVGIFGSASSINRMAVTSSTDVSIYASFNDTITIEASQRVYVQGGVFGSAAGSTGINATVSLGSTNVGIFGTSLNDTVNVGVSSIVGLNLGAGDDELTVDGASQLVAIGDAGVDRVTIRSGFDMLIYLGDGSDRAEVLGGSLIRILGEAGDDQFSVSGGDNVLFDGGNGNEQMFVAGGQALYLRGDAGNDQADIYGGIGISLSGAGGNDRFRLFGSLGGPLDAGLVYASLDGQDGDDTLEVRPLLSVADRGPVPTATTVPYLSIPSWIQVPTWISAPTATTYSSSIELVGGIGSDSIYLEGADRLYGNGGDDNDSLTLQAGNNAEISGGYGLDNITINARGADNRVFGDQDNDTIRANAGVRLGVFGEEGADTIAFYGGVDSFARGGDAIDTMDIYAGTRVTLVGETDDDLLTIRGGTDGIAAGNSGNDQLTILGGDRGLMLGQSGDDTLNSLGGTLSIVSGGDGNDTLNITNRGDELYGDDGDDTYVVLPTTATTLLQSQLLRLRELLYVDPKNFEPEARGSDTLDLSAFSTGATLNLGTVGIYTSLTQGLQSVVAGQLQVILLGSLENITGTSGNDTLTGSSESNRIQGLAGNDTILGLGGDDTLEGGTGNDILDGGAGDDSYVFSTVFGVSLGTDSIVEATNAGTDSLKFKGMPVGLGALDLNLATPQSLAGGLANITLRQSATSGLRGDFEEVIGTPFDDIVFGNELDNRVEPGAGNDIVDGRGGSDIYVYSGRNLGNDQINDASTGSGRDTLDFAAFDSPLALDLALTTPQNLGEATITLGAADSIENVIGTSFDDVILGNVRDNVLFGAAGVDRLEGRAGNDRLVANLPSIVLLDFDSAYRADRGDYNYSVAERNAIQQRITAAYSGFDWVFTQSESQAQSLTADMGRSFVRLAFSQGRGGDVSGDAGEVDFRNIERRLVSEININPLLPTVRALLLQQKGPGYTAQDYSNMVIALTSTIAAHELGHTAGLRHADAFGPIGTGVYSNTDVSQVYPAYAGAFNATETGKHIIASPASVGTTIADAVLPTYFGERESIKLSFNEIGRSQRESNTTTGSHGSIATAETLGSLSPLYVPNLAPTTGYLRSGQSFKVSALAVVGDLNTFTSTSATERDFYRFTGKAGEYVNIELLANSLRPLRGTPFDGELRIYKADGTLMATNDDDFEGTKDATLMDVLLPADGDYYISVGLSDSPAIASTGGRYELFISRFAVGVSGPVPGDTLVGGAGSDTLIGGAADDLFLADGALSIDTDVIDGRAGNDTVDKQGRVYNYTGTSIETVLSTGANVAPTVVVSGPVDGVAGQSTLFTLTATDTDSVDANGPFEFTINWGDGTSSVVSSGVGQRSVNVNHIYASPSATGTYNISASARDARQSAGPAAFRQYAATGYAVMPDPIRLGQTILVIVGTQGADTIVVRETFREELRIRIRDRESSLRIRGRVDGDVNRILVFALDGNDQVVIDDDVDVDTEIWGGRGNDYIEGGEGNDIIWGGAGDDVLFGGEGRDILIGGTGADNIVGDAQDDILIGGLTAYDEEFNQMAPNAFGSPQRLTLNAQRLAMEGILAEWTSNRSYTVRRNNILSGGTGTRLNGNNLLKVSDSTLLSNTVFDDGALDRMWGSCGTDWFFANLDGDNRSAVDRVMDGDASETRTDIDKWF